MYSSYLKPAQTQHEIYLFTLNTQSLSHLHQVGTSFFFLVL